MNSERSLLLVALLLAARSALGADPAPAWSGGADFRLRQEMFDNAIYLNDTISDHARSFQRYRLRAWGEATPGETLKAYGRLMWEGRHYSTLSPFPAAIAHDHTYSGALMFDNLYVQANTLAGWPLSLKLGRQDIIFGNGWLVLDGTPFDGSRTIYFDALRATHAQGSTTFDAILVNNNAKTTLSLDGKREDQIEQDERGLILYARNKWSPATSLDAYYIYKDNDRSAGGAPPRWYNNGVAAGSFADNGHVNAIGARIESTLSDLWSLRAEGAYEWGRRATVAHTGATTDRDLRAFGINGRLTRQIGGEWKQRAHVGYEYLSGDDPNSPSRNEAFDPLWGRWPQWSELLIYTYAPETRIGEITNLHRVNLGWVGQVHPTTQVSLDYHALWTDENTRGGTAGYSPNGSFRGHLFTAWARAMLDKHVSGHLVAEYFVPGSYYDATKQDNAYFLRAELNLTW